MESTAQPLKALVSLPDLNPLLLLLAVLESIWFSTVFFRPNCREIQGSVLLFPSCCVSVPECFRNQSTEIMVISYLYKIQGDMKIHPTYSYLQKCQKKGGRETSYEFPIIYSNAVNRLPVLLTCLSEYSRNSFPLRSEYVAVKLLIY